MQDVTQPACLVETKQYGLLLRSACTLTWPNLGSLLGLAIGLGQG